MWIDIVETLGVALACVWGSRYYVHMLQLESYQLDGYNRWMSKHREKLMGWTLMVGVGATAAYFALSALLQMALGEGAGRIAAHLLTLAAFCAAAYGVNEKLKKLSQKKPLVYTARVKRLYAGLSLVTLLGAALLSFVRVPPYLLFIGVPYLTLVAGGLMQPVEEGIKRHYFNEAKQKLAGRPELIKIGITGSYGKTSTKFILSAILSEKFDVLASPSSFNTPMGLTRVIREQLEPHHQVFIAEMGARHVGDIAELCELVSPQYGVLTSVGPQHLETFGSIENVAKTKYELMEALPREGVGFFAADGGLVDQLYERFAGEKVRAGLDGGFLNMRAEEIEVGAFGSRFTLCDAEGGRVRCQTQLLGRHNIQNVVLGCAVARRLGMDLEQIARGVARIQPVEHRLQLIPGAGGVTVIDDAFNANPAGAAAALEVLRGFPGRRVIVTPGMVELGAQETELNYRFGVQIADSCDIAILVGPKRTRPIYEGMLSAGFLEERVHVVQGLEEATRILGQQGAPGDVVLFENDLPDNYSEG